MNVTDRARQLELNLPACIRSLSLLFLVGASLSLFLWGLSNDELLLPYVQQNQLPAAARSSLIRLMLAGAFGLAVAGAFVGAKFGLGAAARAAKLLAPLAISGLLPFAFAVRLWEGRDVVFLTVVLLCAFGVSVLAKPALEEGLYAPYIPRISFKVPRHFWLVVVCVASLSYAVYFSVSTINNHQNFGTSAFDLGIETNLIYNTLHGGPLFRSAPLGGNMEHGGFHQTYFAFLLAPIYGLCPRAETLLVIQSTFLGASALPFFLFARRKLSESLAALLSCLLLLYAPLHGANLYDFHYQPFGVFFIFLMAYLLESGRSFRILLPVALVTLSVREDMGAMLGALGGYFLLSGKRPLTALWVAALGSAYVVAMKMYVMPEIFMHGRSSFTNIYRLLLPEGEQGFGGVLKTVIGNPVFTLDQIILREKLVYLGQIFVPLALFPLRRKLTLLLLIPGLVLTLLSTAYPALIMTSFQYTSYWTPMVFLSVVIGLQALAPRDLPQGAVSQSADLPSAAAQGGALVADAGRQGLAQQRAWVLALVVGVLLTSIRYGSVFQVETSRGAFDPVHLRETAEGQGNLADFRALSGKIPKHAKLAASEWLISHLADRKDAYAIRNGLLDAEYVLFWLHPEKFRSDERPVLLAALFKDRAFGVVERRGMFVLAKRGAAFDKTRDSGLRREISVAGTPRARRSKESAK